MKTSKEIRKTFLSFFSQKLHQIVPSAPIVVKNDPTLMFVNAGMNPFKDVFLGIKSPSSKRIADTQKCLRVSGKHNDLEEVGHDTYHHTMFEMLGNWSFGDYYKAEAIKWAWELLVSHFELSPDRIYATVFGGDEADGLGLDEEAKTEWLKFLPEAQILPFGKKDNFWEMGETGPCGPCSEIHLDLRSEAERAAQPAAQLVNADHPQVVEIWNLVFIQFNRKEDGKLEELPEKHVDTGMGFERMVMALQGKQSSYDTDLFDASRQFLEQKTGLVYAQSSEQQQIAMRVVMDHIRAVSFAIGDGQIPSNTGAGYVIRRILRRASRYAYSYLGLTQPFLHEMVALLSEEYAGVFEELEAQKAFIMRTIKAEEESFLRTLGRGIQLFEDYLAENKGQDSIDGAFAFKLYDTFGFPVDLTELLAREQGLQVDMDDFRSHLEAQQARARAAGKKDVGDWVVVQAGQDLPRFLGYDTLSLETRIRQYRTVKTDKKTLYQVVLEETPFYAESGGQIGDKGTLTQGETTLKVLDTQRENELIVHQVDRLPAAPDGDWNAAVYPGFREKVKANHSATHLLHAALREVLGEHVEQRGSLVSDKVLRFDFSHFSKVSAEELREIETQVNSHIAAAIPLQEHREIPIAEAKAMGAMALFGEKYGEQVRVIVFDPDYSVELCGGTHVENTSRIRLFKLISEGSVAAGIRRVEAYTGDRALQYLTDQVHTLQQISEVLKSPQNLPKAVADLYEQNRQLEKELQQMRAGQVQQLKQQLLDQGESIEDIQVIRAQVNVGSADDLKQLSFALRKESTQTLILLGTVINGKPLLSLIQSEDLAETGRFHAGNMIRGLAKHIQGGGGGQAFYATAGGKNAEGLDQALSELPSFL